MLIIKSKSNLQFMPIKALLFIYFIKLHPNVTHEKVEVKIKVKEIKRIYSSIFKYNIKMR